jgi:hypothetical protein
MARPAGTARAMRRRVARARTLARRGARAASEDAWPRVAAGLRQRMPRAAHRCERRGHGAWARRRGRPILCC